MREIFCLIKYIVLILVIFVVVNSCKKAPTILFDDTFAIFKYTSNPSIHKDGEITYEFNKKRHQIVYSTDKMMYMVTNMEQTEFYSLVLPSTPRFNKSIDVKIKSVGIDAIKPAIYTMEVVQEVGTKIWLWDKKTSTGFVLDFM